MNTKKNFSSEEFQQLTSSGRVIFAAQWKEGQDADSELQRFHTEKKVAFLKCRLRALHWHAEREIGEYPQDALGMVLLSSTHSGVKRREKYVESLLMTPCRLTKEERNSQAC